GVISEGAVEADDVPAGHALRRALDADGGAALAGQVDQAAGLEAERVERRLVEAGDAAMDVERERLSDAQVDLARGVARLARSADSVRGAAWNDAPHLFDTALRLVSHPTLVLLCAGGS